VVVIGLLLIPPLGVLAWWALDDARGAIGDGVRHGIATDTVAIGRSGTLRGARRAAGHGALLEPTKPVGAVRFMPQALAATRSSLEPIDPRLLDASRSPGRGPTRPSPASYPSHVPARARLPLNAEGAPGNSHPAPGLTPLRPASGLTRSLGDYAAAALSALLVVALATPFVVVLATRLTWELGVA
jgi:hypothetical protein